MRLKDIAEIKVNFPDADFWLVRRGSNNTVGQPVNEFNPEHIGIKIVNPDLLFPRYLFYCLEAAHANGEWKNLAHGTTQLVNIRTSDVRDIELEAR